MKLYPKEATTDSDSPSSLIFAANGANRGSAGMLAILCPAYASLAQVKATGMEKFFPPLCRRVNIERQNFAFLGFSPAFFNFKISRSIRAIGIREERSEES
jgi:hypothetical protein